MLIVVGPACVFFSAFLLHVAIWRCWRPRNTVRGLISIFTVAGLLAILVSSVFVHGLQAMDIMYGVALYAAIVLAYLISYTGLEGQSPSALIVTAAYAAAPRGITREDILQLVTEEVFVLSRVTDLVKAGHIRQDEYGRYHLTARGRNFVGLFLLPRTLMMIDGRGG